MKTELDFIRELENRSAEQKKLVETQVIPDWARGVAGWLAINPWRVLVPIAIVAYYLLRTAYGIEYRELILGLFGGFAR